jgi:hypothetical protein
MSDDPAVWQKTVTVNSDDRAPIKIHTPDGRVLVIRRNEAGFKPPSPTRKE